MINIDSTLEELESLIATLNEKAEELNSTLLFTEEDAVSSLREKLLMAVEELNNDVTLMKKHVTNANNNKKW